MPETTTLRAPTKPAIKAESLLGVHTMDRVHVFIDAQQLLGMQRVINRKIDLKRFYSFFKDNTRLIRVSYFSLMREDMSEAATRVIDMAEYSGFDIVRKWGIEFQETSGQYRFRGSVVPEMTVAMIDAVESGAEHIILISGDGEMSAAMEAVKAREARITVIGVESTISEDLRRGTDGFIDLMKLEPAGFLSYNER